MCSVKMWRFWRGSFNDLSLQAGTMTTLLQLFKPHKRSYLLLLQTTAWKLTRAVEVKAMKVGFPCQRARSYVTKLRGSLSPCTHSVSLQKALKGA